MILIDPRIGTASPHIADLQPYFAAIGVPCQMESLTAGDLAFTGNGPDGLATIGIERKRLLDLISCIHSGRLAATQIPEMAQIYDHMYLVIEGYWRTDPETGILQTPGGAAMAATAAHGAGNHGHGGHGNGRSWRDITVGGRRMATADMDAFLWSIETIAGVRLRWSSGPEPTVRQIATIYRQWQKPWEAHKSFHVFQSLQTGGSLTRPSFARRVAKELPGIGWERSKAVAEHFGTVEAMVLADPADWQQVEGIGKTIAGNVWQALRSKK